MLDKHYCFYLAYDENESWKKEGWSKNINLMDGKVFWKNNLILPMRED